MCTSKDTQKPPNSNTTVQPLDLDNIYVTLVGGYCYYPRALSQ